MNVNDRVQFIGPEYHHEGGPRIGQLGTIIRRDGHYSKAVGKPKVEIITVMFDGDEKATNLDINRIEKL